MIIDAWKSKTKVINGKQTITHYEKIDEISNLNTNTRVRWVCDNPRCKTPHKLHSISVGHLNKKTSKHNTLENQMCHSCQMSGEKNPMYGNQKTLRELVNNDDKYDKLIDKYRKRWSGENNISHRDDVKIKKGQFLINEGNLKQLLKNKGETLLNHEGTNKNCLLTIKCENNHIREQKYNSWRKGHGCKECYWLSIGITKEDKCDYEYYKKLVYKHTRNTMRKYSEIINPYNLKRGRKDGDYHLDHRFSISEGFKNGVLPIIIGSTYNLEYIPNKDNLSKLDKCSVNITELCDIYYKNILE